MELALPAPVESFVSNARRAGDAAEKWATRNLYCARCESDKLSPTPVNNKVVDFECPQCSLAIQLKAKSARFGPKFANSAYEPKMAAIRARKFPDYALLHYDHDDWQVRNVTLVPGFFLTERAIEKRKPLSATARRAGWVGSNVVLSNLPTDAKVPVILDGVVAPREQVREKYQRFEVLRRRQLGAATWTVDVLEQVRKFAPTIGATFTLAEFYNASENALSKLHPENRHVRDKMRQQLQVLRDQGIIGFSQRGLYAVIA